VCNGKLKEFIISPADFGIKEQALSAIQGDTPDYNVNAITKVFSGQGKLAHTHAIAMNAASLLWLHNTERSLEQHFIVVMDAISNKLPMQTIEHAARISRGTV